MTPASMTTVARPRWRKLRWQKSVLPDNGEIAVGGVRPGFSVRSEPSETSRRDAGRLAFTSGREGEACADIITREIGKVVKKLVFRHPEAR